MTEIQYECLYCHSLDVEELIQRDGYPTGDIVLLQCRHCDKTWEIDLLQTASKEE